MSFLLRFPSCSLGELFKIEFYAGLLGQTDRSVFVFLKLEGLTSFLFWFVY